MSIGGLRKSESEAILRSLAAGVTPTVGLHHIAVGRRREVEQLLLELDVAAEGGGGCKVVAGSYGSGKTFLLNLVGYMATRRGFVVCRGEMQPNRAFCGAGRGLAMYRELMESMSTRIEPAGGALPRILERWFGRLQSQAGSGLGVEGGKLDSGVLLPHLGASAGQISAKLERFQGGFDFVQVLNAYLRGYLAGDDDLQRSALRWLMGDIHTKAEAFQALGVRSFVSDDNWYEYVRLWAAYLAETGHCGLLLLIDECDNLYRISHPQTRMRNYDLILRMFNDAMQGRLEHLYLVMGGTREFVEDNRRGLHSSEALKTRLSRNPLETVTLRDMAQPVLELQPLLPEELAVLLTLVRDIHAQHYAHQTGLTDDDITAFVQSLLSRPGTKEFGTARAVLREFIGALNICHQNPGTDALELLRGRVATTRGGVQSASLNARGGDPFAGFQTR